MRVLDDELFTFRSSYLELWSDNQAVVSVISTGRTSNDFMGLGLRYVHFQMAIRDAARL